MVFFSFTKIAKSGVKNTRIYRIVVCHAIQKITTIFGDFALSLAEAATSLTYHCLERMAFSGNSEANFAVGDAQTGNTVSR